MQVLIACSSCSNQLTVFAVIAIAIVAFIRRCGVKRKGGQS